MASSTMSSKDDVEPASARRLWGTSVAAHTHSGKRARVRAARGRNQRPASAGLLRQVGAGASRLPTWRLIASIVRFTDEVDAQLAEGAVLACAGLPFTRHCAHRRAGS